MSTAPTMPLVPVEEYLRTSYEHDFEYVDGVLVERGMPTPAHAALQMILGEHLRKHCIPHGFGVLSECRVEVVKRSRYRIPDVLVFRLPIPRTKVLESIPVAVIEIWSPDDRIVQQMARFREYWERGIQQIVVMDPEEFATLVYESGSLTEKTITELKLAPGVTIPFDTNGVLAQLRSELGD